MNFFKFIVAAYLLSSLVAQASDYNYVCKQRTDRTPVDAKIGKVLVSVKHLKTMASATEYRGQYWDSIDKVLVEVNTVKNGKATNLRTLTAIATSEDVYFGIDNNGIKFHLYLDELEEAGITLKINGRKKEISLVCDYDTPPSVNQRSSLIVQDEGRMISVAWLIKEGIDVQTYYGYDKFCYNGDAYAVTDMIKKWNKEGYFFSGGGGGFELKEVEVIRGIVTYDIRMKLEDEVVPGELRTVTIKPCK